MMGGAGLFAAGYVPVAATGLPSTAGIIGRVALGVATIGLYPIFCTGRGYPCRADHGAVQLMLPIAGPFLFVENHPKDSLVNENGRPLSSFARSALYASGAAQAAGAAMMLGAIALGDSYDNEGKRVPGQAVATAGTITLATAYGSALLVGFPSVLAGGICALERSCRSHFGGAWLGVPLVGPFVLAGTQPRDEVLADRGTWSAPARALLVANGALQVAGLAMLVGGLVAAPSGSETAAKGASWHVLPMTSGGTLGVTASLDGW